jgi:regulator of cell morphogenesis and NO signaling
MNITPETHVGAIATEVPSTIRVFQQFGIDFCCGGKKPLRDVCADQKLSYEEVARAIEAATVTPTDDHDWATAPLGSLVDHIINRYHDTLRSELPRLQAMADKVLSVHGAHAPELQKINAYVRELAADLDAHMNKEEMILFPSIKELESVGRSRFPLGALSMPMSVMEQEHDRAGELLAGLNEQSGGYAPPEWACNTYRGLYAGLEELERDLHVHVHLENNILFPRTAELERTLAGR